MNQVFNTTKYSSRPAPRPRVSLGNSQARYHSHVEGIRKRFYINSTRNSEDTPQWMTGTQQYFRKKNINITRQLRNKDATNSSGLYEERQPLFQSVRQTNIYENTPKYPDNVGGQFHSVQKKKARSNWEMKKHTYQLDWPKKQQRKASVSHYSATSNVNNRSYILPFNPENSFTQTSRDMCFHLPKYGIRQTPLHIQKATPLKIGHSTTVDTYRIK